MFSFETTVFSPQTPGGAIVVSSGGVVDLAESVFESNYVNGTLSDSIVNLGGEVHCSITCLPVCTSCQHNDDGAAAPSPNPTTQVVPKLLPFPTLAPKSSPAVPFPVSAPLFFAVSAVALVLLLGAAIFCLRHFWVWRYNAASRAAEQRPPQGSGSCELLGCTTDKLIVDDSSGLDYVELEHAERWTQLLDPVQVCTMMRASPAAVFVVNQAMRIILWSPGK